MDTVSEEILSRFNESWAETEKFYADLIDNNPDWDRLIPIYLFIQKLKKRGQNKYFRLGTSIHYLIISRSVESGLRPDQKFIKINAIDNYFEVTLKDASKMFRQYTIKDLEDERLTGLLQTLKSTLID